MAGKLAVLNSATVWLSPVHMLRETQTACEYLSLLLHLLLLLLLLLHLLLFLLLLLLLPGL
jgi:hypothetical protein